MIIIVNIINNSFYDKRGMNFTIVPERKRLITIYPEKSRNGS